MKYDDILFLEHPEPKTCLRMPAADRAAQFAPFAALTGYDASIREAARITDRKIELDEEERAVLDEKLQILMEEDPPEVEVMYFVSDATKEGGSYHVAKGKVKKIDVFRKEIVLDDIKIPFADILDLEF